MTMLPRWAKLAHFLSSSGVNGWLAAALDELLFGSDMGDECLSDVEVV